MLQFTPPSPFADSALLSLPPVRHTNLAEHCLPNRDIVMTVGRWDVGQVAHYLSSFDRNEFDRNGRPPGFAILSRRIISRHERSRHYPEPSDLPEEQRQPYGDCGSSRFDKALVALVGPCLVGIVYCEWLYFKRDEPFWGYNLSFIDVHESWREHGIGSALIKQLNSEPWLKGRNFCLTSYTLLGQERIAHVIDRELTSTEFALKQPWY